MLPHGRILLAEAVIPDDSKHTALPTWLLDLSTLALCNGRQRDKAQFTALFQRAGLALVRIHDGPDMCSLIEARRA
ncbi:methyltransferase [Nocardia brasiliensis]|uniref:methyltransferase n=1 Tax=Nocardia brasiliensis TaxID=37326 RepID=UPI003D79BFE7